MTSSVLDRGGPYVLDAMTKPSPIDADATTLDRSSAQPHLLPVTPGNCLVPQS